MFELTVVLICLVAGSRILRARADAEDEALAVLTVSSPHERGADRPARRKTERRRVVYWLFGAALFAAMRSLSSHTAIAEQIVFAAIGSFGGELIYRAALRRRASREKAELEFYLPLIIERIVMGVSAGLDVQPAIREASRDAKDPVSALFTKVVRLTEGGLSMEEALTGTGGAVDCSAVKHAFTHLALAHREGGELVRPLRELSDATQAAYQETVEEQIAKLPVKAVMPLLLTFAGLIICFITIPLIQVSSLTMKVVEDASK